MRQGQQNRRGRGRNNRKGQNPLARSFESNGPDVKIRGTPTHIAEKYMSLARDALSSGDPVLAENYLQHAEHYNRIIMAYREQQVQSGDPGGMGHRPRGPGFGDQMGADDDMGPEEGDDLGQAEQPVQMSMRGRPDQPGRGHDQQAQGYERPERHHRHERHERHERHDRMRHDDQGMRQGGDDGFGPQQHAPRYRERRPYPGSEPQPTDTLAGGGDPAQQGGQPQGHGPRPGRMPRRDRFAQGGGERGHDRGHDRNPDRGGHEQPDFLRRPIRRPRRDSNGEEGHGAGSDAAPVGEGGGEPQIDKSRL